MAKRIDSLRPGQHVTLAFYYRGKPTTEKAVFVEISGEGDKRRARFRSVKSYPTYEHEEVTYYEWEAYRYKNRWAYGTSADRLSIVSVDN